jgi:hypothetical protein
MSKPKKQHEHVQGEIPKTVVPETRQAGITSEPDPGQPDQVAEAGFPDGRLTPAMSARFWVAILLWAGGFGLLVLHEVISNIWRG